MMIFVLFKISYYFHVVYEILRIQYTYSYIHLQEFISVKF